VRTHGLIALLLVAGCGGLAGTLDTGALPVRVEANVAVDAPTPPQAPAPPSFLPCPAGWQEAPAGSGSTQTLCEPWAADAGTPACAVDAARFVDVDGCEPVGTACTSDDWASGLPATNVRYVKLGAAAGGTGTRAAPFATVAEAMAGAAPGTVLALSQGTFVGEVRVSPGVTVWGACVGQTVLQGATGGMATVRAGGLAGVVKNLRITGPTLGVLANPSGNSLRLEDVVIDGARGVALLVGNTASVTGRNVVVRNTEASASGAGGRGVSAEYGGQLTLERAVFENNRENAINVVNAMSRVQLTDAVLRATRPRTDGLMGRAATANSGATLELTRTLVEQNREVGLLAGPQSTLTLTDVLVRDTIGVADDGQGIVLEGATGTWQRVALQRNRSVSVQVRSAATLNAQHLLITDTLETATTGRDGVGLDVIERSQVTVDHAHLARNAMGAVGVADSTATLNDVSLLQTRAPSGAPDIGSALQVVRGASVTVARLEVRESQGVGVMVDGVGTLLQGGDVTVRDGQPFAGTAGGGAGLVVQAGAHVTLSRLALAGNQSVGVQVTDANSQADLADLSVVDTASEAVSGEYGRALHAQGGALVTLTRARLEHAADTGLFVTAATVNATHLTVRDVTKRTCTTAGTCDDRGGSSVVVLEPGAHFGATHFLFDTSAQCGLQLATQGDATLSMGEVRGHPIGVCLQVDGFDLSRLSDQVVYDGNGRNLSSLNVPLPSLTAPTYHPR
jgi:hypothetical protein